MTSSSFTTKVHGHVTIVDKETGEVLMDKDNAVHNLNMAIAIARGLSNTSNANGKSAFQIYQMKLGNGGSSVNSLDQITFQPPNVTSPTADLYNTTYSQIVDGSAGTQGGSVTYQVNNTNQTSVVITTMTIGANEPSGQQTTDSPTGLSVQEIGPNGVITGSNSTYAFDELGLFTATDNTNQVPSMLLTHIIFSPILKTLNRELVITYTLTISVS